MVSTAPVPTAWRPLPGAARRRVYSAIRSDATSEVLTPFQFVNLRILTLRTSPKAASVATTDDPP